VRSVKAMLIFAALFMVSACSTLTGNSKNAAFEDEITIALSRSSALEVELAHVKSENVRLSDLLLEVQRENETLLAQSEGTSGMTRFAMLGDAERLNPSSIASPGPQPQVNAVVEEATAPEIERSGVLVEDAPRLVQPSFASAEAVFENEANDEIETSSVLFGVHLASYRRTAEARDGWRKLQRENPDELGLLEPRLVTVTLPGKGVFLRLIGGGFSSEGKAEALCASLKTRGLFCKVSGFIGQRLSILDAG